MTRPQKVNAKTIKNIHLAENGLNAVAFCEGYANVLDLAHDDENNEFDHQLVHDYMNQWREQATSVNTLGYDEDSSNIGALFVFSDNSFALVQNEGAMALDAVTIFVKLVELGGIRYIKETSEQR